MSPQDQKNTLRAFFTGHFGGQEGLLCISYMRPQVRESWKDIFFEYPTEIDNALEFIINKHHGFNMYFSPMLYSGRSRVKENVKVTPVIWSDLDLCEPENLLVQPTQVVESSPGRYQGYWAMETPLDPDDAEDLAKRIAYHHADQGADKSGFDLSQALRIPTTFNYKYLLDDEVPVVKLIDVNRKVYRLEDFKEYPLVKGYTYIDEEMPPIEGVPDGNDILYERRLQLNPQIFKLYQEEPGKSWSEPLWNLQMLLFEAGLEREEVFAVAMSARCNKYKRDGRSPRLLWKEVCRCQARYEQNELMLMQGGVEEEVVRVSLLTADERDRVRKQPDTFVERYAEWARSLGDAAPQYHQAGAFIALSSILAGRVRLPTSFGTIIPNLWFMILADTTLTRKSTAMDIAMDMIAEIDPDAVLATDGSIEGLLTSMATRPSRPSVFLRDEFSGLLEQITKKDYMAGMAELLTKLYDGKMQKRILRKETIEVKEPVLILFAGGIKNKITSMLTTEQVSSGFMPRFIFITAESDITRLKPIGPPTQRTLNNGEAIRNELSEMFEFYSQPATFEIKSLKVQEETMHTHKAELTDEAWMRYNLLEHTMLEAGLTSGKPEIMTPTYDRLSKSILKAATLIAASRKEQTPVVTVDDILRAIHYGEQWKVYVEDVMDNIGKGTQERQLENIRRYIDQAPGVPRSKIMQQYHLNAREATQIFDTLEQRGLVVVRKQGRTSTYWPTKKEYAHV